MVRLKQIVAALLAILMVGFGLYAFASMLPGIREAHAANLSIALVGFAVGGWNATTSPNPTITVHQGDTVSLKLSSGDAATHQFLLDVDGDGTASDDCPSVDPCSTFFSSSTPITLSFTANLPGTYTYYCTVHPTSMLGSFIVKAAPDYALSANPTSLTLAQGNSTTSTVTVASLSGFTGVVNLSTGVSPPGPATVISPNSVTVPSNGNSLATLTVSAVTSTPAGKYNVTVTGSNGTTTRSVIIPVIVEQAIGFKAVMTFGGANATMSGRFVVEAAIRVLSGSTFLTVVNVTTGAPIYSKTVRFNMTYNIFGMAHFLDDIPTSPYWLSANCGVNVPADSVSCFLSRTPDINHGGAVDINDYSIVSFGFNQRLGSPGYNPAADLTASGIINIADLSIEGLYFEVTEFLPP
jgi:plastocyanin